MRVSWILDSLFSLNLKHSIRNKLLVPRWYRKTLSASLTGTPKSQLFTDSHRWKRPKPTRKDLQWEYKEGIIMRQQEGLSSDKVKSHTPRWVIHKQENNYNCRDAPKGWRGLNSTLGSTAQRSSTGKTLPPLENLALKATGLLLGVLEGWWK